MRLQSSANLLIAISSDYFISLFESIALYLVLVLINDAEFLLSIIKYFKQVIKLFVLS